MARIIWQTHDDPAKVSAHIAKLLSRKDLKSVRVGTAYLRWDGWALISSQLEGALSRGAALKVVCGVDNGVTSPDGLLYCLYLKRLYQKLVTAAVVRDKYRNATFHPKIWLFEYDEECRAIVGSANVTGAGLSRNVELCVELRFENKSNLAVSMAAFWASIADLGTDLTVTDVRLLDKEGALRSEREETGKSGDEILQLQGLPKAKKPLFRKILEQQSASKRSEALGDMDKLSDKPTYLYLEILEHETGGHGPNNPGYQVQLPVATLAAFFGVGPDEQKPVEFQFPTSNVNVTLTHFENNTHRVRLLPLRDIPRPAVVRFERIDDNTFGCLPIAGDLFQETIDKFCTEQTRSGARRWGIN